MADITEFIKKMEALEKAYVRLPAEVAAIAVNFSKERFREQNWWDTAKQPWKARKQPRAGSKKKSQTLLVNTARLMRSVRKVSANQHQIIIGTDVPYAKIHNEGGTIKETVSVKSFTKRSHSRKKHTRTFRGVTKTIEPYVVQSHTVGTHPRKMNIKIPARPFLGQSAELERRIMKYIETAFEEALK